jgi:hypothetical protein
MRFIFHYGSPDVNRRRLASPCAFATRGIICNALLARRGRRRDIRKFDKRLVNANPDRYSQKKTAFIFEWGKPTPENLETMSTKTFRRNVVMPFAVVDLNRRASYALILLAAAKIALFALPASAHHSYAPFDSTQEVVLEGTVLRMEWTNPHVWIRLNVTDAGGNTVEWSIEASNPLDLGRKGWTRNTFKPGDKVSITVNPARNKKSYGGFVRATMPDGTQLSEGSVTGEADAKSNND